MSDNPLSNIGELSKPATVLVEKISDAIGGIFKPYQIVRVAKAESEARRIETESQIEVTDLERRAFARFMKEEARKQKNIEEITQKALPHLKEDSQPEKVEEDWIANFFDKSRLISDSDMQDLWSRVLAGEANSPGSYSKRTISLLSSLDKKDADLFTRLCGFGWQIGDVVPLIYDVKNEIYNEHNVNFNTLSHLESIGLIQFGGIVGFQRLKLPKTFQVLYYGKSIKLELSNDTDNALEIGKVRLTQAGQELAQICGSQQVQGFFEFVCEKWTSQGYIKKEEPSQDIQPPIEAE